MTQPEQFKLHNDTCEATDIVYDTLGKIRYQIVADMIQQQFAQKMSERSTKNWPKGLNYSMAVHDVLRKILRKPYLYNKP